ncbi:MAG: aldo/keto reductase [Clostridia bacterium]|nr:aldo/keto reductase [Clostridia bacterium]
MQYRIDPKTGNRLSVLGYGCMRFTRKGKNIDQEKAEKEMAYAIEQGVNYFDTAYIYPGNEVAVGKFLAKGYRDKVYLATKLPHYLVKSIEDADRIFEEELKRLQTDHIDYYLMHMLTDVKSWQRLCEMGMVEWIQKRKEAGQIRQLGFSYHGGTPGFLEVLDAYDWDFCQIQFNYMDEYTQGGVPGIRRAAEKGIPVIIMEPLRGGRLAGGLPEGAKKVFKKAKGNRSPVEWGLRWIWNHPEVTTVLSGMNDMSQVEENIRIASDAKAGSLTEEEFAVFEKAKQEINKAIKVGCTGCGYCMPCPQGVDIPVCFRCYNVRFSDGWFNGLREYFMCTTLRAKKTNASLCVGCGKCEKHCPQAIPIRKELENVKATMERLPYRVARFFSRFVKF